MKLTPNEKKILKIEIRKMPSLASLGLVRLHPTKQHPLLFPPIEYVVIALAQEYAEKWNFEKFVETKEDLKCTSCEEYGRDTPVWSVKDEEMLIVVESTVVVVPCTVKLPATITVEVAPPRVRLFAPIDEAIAALAAVKSSPVRPENEV